MRFTLQTAIKFNLFKCSAFLASTLLFLAPSFAGAVDLELTWDAPQQNEDGSTLSDLAGYKVYFGESSRSYSEVRDAQSATKLLVKNLQAGKTIYFAVTAYNGSAMESDYSSELRVELPMAGPNDQDGDGILDGSDNCPTVFNPQQSDDDGDGIGNACENAGGSAKAARLDFDGDGVSDFSFSEKSRGRGGALKFRIISSRDQSESAIELGTGSSIEAHGDYNGDGRYDLAVVNPDKRGLLWTIRDSATGEIRTESFGKVSDEVLAGCNFDGDTIFDKTVVRRSTLLFLSSASGVQRAHKLPLLKNPHMVDCRDFNGDGIDELVVLVLGEKGNSKLNKLVTKKRRVKSSSKNLFVLSIGNEALASFGAKGAKQVIASDINGDNSAEPGYIVNRGGKSELNYFVNLSEPAIQFTLPKTKSLTSVRLKGLNGGMYDGIFIGEPNGASHSMNFYDMQPESFGALKKGNKILGALTPSK